MIDILRSDALRLLLRPRTLALLAVAAFLAGSFVRATQHSHSSELVAEAASGALLGSLGSLCALMAWIASLVFGILLAHEDRTSGLIGQFAIRPVSRVEYAVGRGLGLGYAAALASLVVVVVAGAFSGISSVDLPTSRPIERAIEITVAGNPLDANDLSAIDRGEVARFRFAASERRNFSLRLEPRVKSLAVGATDRFDGFASVRITLRPEGSEPTVLDLERVRPLGSYEFAENGAVDAACTVEVENRTPGALLSIAGDQLVGNGEAESPFRQVGYALVLLLLGSLLLAICGFVLAIAFSAGTAALAGSTLLLIGLSRGAIDALLAESSARGESTWIPLVRRLVELVPDLSRFDVSDRLAGGGALSLLEFARESGTGVAQFLCGIALAALFLSWRDR